MKIISDFTRNRPSMETDERIILIQGKKDSATNYRIPDKIPPSILIMLS